MTDHTPADILAKILRRHPQGVTMRELIGALTGKDCKFSEAQQHCRDAISDGRVRVGWGGRLYAPTEREE